jgi:uncharacterized protein YkwD
MENMPLIPFLLAAALLSQSASQPRDTAALEQEMFRLVNVERQARGLEKLESLAPLAEVARRHSQAMAERNEVTHEIDDAPSFETRVKNAVPDACHFGENITKHYTVEYALADLLRSKGHRGNILDPKYKILGIGIVRNDDGLLYITQDFIGLCDKKEKARLR